MLGALDAAWLAVIAIAIPIAIAHLQMYAVYFFFANEVTRRKALSQFSGDQCKSEVAIAHVSCECLLCVFENTLLDKKLK